MAKYEGGCACGALRFTTDAEPIMAGHCQCRVCQKLSGAGHSTFAVFPAPAVQVMGDVKYWSYTADSGKTASRGHCPTCGSMVLGKSESFMDMIAVNLGSLDVPARITPQMGFYSSRAAPWDHMDPGLQRFPTMPPM